MRFATYDEAYGYLAASTNYELMDRFPPADRAFKLERITDLLSELGHPERGWSAVHIAGTKGKGSTAAMAESILRRAGLRSGLYTSPHVVHLRERIQVEGRWITEEEFARVFGAVADAADRVAARRPERKPTFFELMTAAAFAFFRSEGVEVGVAEVGLGGRLDATNVLAPLACAITHVGLDHVKVLGATVEEIAREKAGILKAGVPAVTSSCGAALETIEGIARERGTPLEVLGREIVATRRTGPGDAGEVFDLWTPVGGYERLGTPLLGAHQVANAAIAVRLAERVGEKKGKVGEDAIREGLRSVRWEARVEVVSERPRIILDSAHNVDSARALVETLREKFRWDRLILVVGISSDKDYEGFLGTVVPKCDSVIVTAAHSPRAMAPGALAELARRMGCTDCVEAADAGQAIRLARDKATVESTIVISGSFYLAGEAREELRGG
ncbi:MAG: folylpolyglutamate synthase/dihydrofolate synthase family protein [Planctomycetota bacterium]